MYSFEICVSSAQGCEVAEQTHATRVELCAALTEGGTTPSFGMVKQCRKICQNVKLHVIIRPRGGDFLYDENELQCMEHDLDLMRQLKVDGVVLGCLTAQGDVDKVKMLRLLEHCDGMSVTFHRAFDVCRDPHQALEDIISLGRVERILTSGWEASAEQGIELLKDLQQQSQGRITLMAGAGVNAQNIATIAQATHITEFHFSGKGTKPSQMEFHHPRVFMGLPNMDEYVIPVTSFDNVAATIKALRENQSLELLLAAYIGCFMCSFIGS